MEPTGEEGLFDERITRYPWLVGVLLGTWTFVAGYVAMGVVILVGTGNFDALLEYPGKVLTDVGFTFYNAHNVVIDVVIVESILNPGDLPSGIDTLSGSTQVPKVIYYAVPIVVLFALGGLTARTTLPADASVGEAVLPAAALSAGYTAFAVLGTWAFQAERFEGAVMLVPNLTEAAVFCLGYSLACSLLAGVAVVGWRNRADLRDEVGV